MKETTTRHPGILILATALLCGAAACGRQEQPATPQPPPAAATTAALPAAPAALPAAPAAATAPDSYPLDTCVVTGEKLGAMGDVVKFDYKGREIRFCCQACIAKFLAEPDKYLKILDDAAAAKK